MSFFDDPKKAGLAFMILGILQIIGGIALIILGVIDDDYKLATAAVLGIGQIIVGAIMFGYGQKVRGGAISKKIDILAEFVKITGVVTIINGIFGAIAVALGDGGIGTAIVSAIISIIIGLIIIFIGSRINDGKQDLGDKIIWIILLVLFVLALIGSVIGLLDFILGTIENICNIFIYIFMLCLLFDGEVKKEMGM
ncbi:MAG: hypothetical protein IJ856_03950 [Candidatus Methanomethylophilaceae archaeon]|nr:hypothetical protein [Candidatus Methanomethylophilaceae archaeon]